MDTRRTKYLRDEVGSMACIVGRIVKSHIKWAGHMFRMKDERLPKRSETTKQEGGIKRGRPKERLKGCVKRYLRKAEKEENEEKRPTTWSND